MSIAEKLTTIADNMQRVYEAGQMAGGGEDYLKYATEVNFNNLNLFGKEEVVLTLDNLTSLYNFNFVYSSGVKSPANTTVKHLTINCPNKITNLNNAFARQYLYDKYMQHLTLNVDTSEAVNANYAFSNLDAVKVIDGQPLNLSKVASCQNTIRGMAKLEEIRFVENSIPNTISFAFCPVLSNDSIQSIIDGLGDLTGGTAKTVTFSATTGAKLTDEQKATITEKNWELVY